MHEQNEVDEHGKQMNGYKTSALIPAAGQGKRMKTHEKKQACSKQFLKVNGLPVIVYTLRAFQNSPSIDEVVLVLRKDEIEFCRKEIVEAYGLDKCLLVAGGKERQDSVFLGLRALSGNPPRLVVVHDAVRPLVTVELIEKVVEAARRSGAAIAAVPAKDTVKLVSADGVVESTPGRSSVWQVQTPQAFYFKELWEAARSAKARNLAATDEASLLEAAGKKVAVVTGSYRNLKITTSEDLEIAALFLSR